MLVKIKIKLFRKLVNGFKFLIQFIKNKGLRAIDQLCADICLSRRLIYRPIE
jgi:hypothetical protein